MLQTMHRATLPLPLAAAVLVVAASRDAQAVPVTLVGTQESPITVETPGAAPFACPGTCVVELTPGLYRARMGSLTKALDVTGPLTIEGVAAQEGRRSGGLTLGVVGTAAYVIGQVGWISVVLSRRTASTTAVDYFPEGSGKWIVLSFAGIALATPGWILFGTSGARIRVRKDHPIAVGAFATPLPGGAAMVVGGTF